MAYTDVLAKQFYNLAGTSAPRFGAGGEGDISQASSYFRNLLGDRSAQGRAIAPALAASRASADAARKELATKGTSRTGGTAAASQQVEDEQRKQLMTLLFGAQGQGAAELGNLGSNQIQAMLNALSTGLTSAQSDINSRRAASAQMWSSLIGAAGGAAGGFLGGLGGRGGGSTSTYTPSPAPPPPPTFTEIQAPQIPTYYDTPISAPAFGYG